MHVCAWHAYITCCKVCKFTYSVHIVSFVFRFSATFFLELSSLMHLHYKSARDWEMEVLVLSTGPHYTQRRLVCISIHYSQLQLHLDLFFQPISMTSDNDFLYARGMFMQLHSCN